MPTLWEVLTKASENRPTVDPVDDGYPALQVHRQARDGEVDDQLVCRGPKDPVSGNKVMAMIFSPPKKENKNPCHGCIEVDVFD